MKNTTAKTSAIAACTFQLKAGETRIQLFPDGKFQAIDGRPGDVPGGFWLMDQVAADQVIAAARARQNDYVVDYEHQTMLAAENGQPAPAAGWLKGATFEYIPGEGLFANNPNWTAAAADYIAADQYRYFSPVFHYDRTTGRVQLFRHAALVNDPGIDGMDKVVAALKNTITDTTTEEEILMNELLKKLLAAIGIELTDADLTDENKLKELVDQAVTKVDEQKSKATAAEGEVAALKASSGKPDLTKFVPIDVADALRGQLAALKAGSDVDQLDKLIGDARADGRLVEAEEAWAREVAKDNGIAALKTLLDKRPPVAALKGLQTDATKKPGTADKGDQLTAEDLAVCKAFGIDPAEYRKSRSA